MFVTSHRLGAGAAALALLSAPAMEPIDPHPERRAGRKTIYTAHKGVYGKQYRPNGKREVARRLAQIEAGQLSSENGLVLQANEVSGS